MGLVYVDLPPKGTVSTSACTSLPPSGPMFETKQADMAEVAHTHSKDQAAVGGKKEVS